MEEGQAVKRPLLIVTGKLESDCNHEYSGASSSCELSSSASSVTHVVVLSTLVATCGSYAHGNAVGYSSPAQSGIVNDLGLTLAECSFFGSILNIGAMFGALCSGKIADVIDHGVSDLFFITGWLTITFSKISAAGTCLGSLLIGFSFFLQGLHFGKKITPVLELAGVLVSFGFFSLEMEGIPWIIASKEYFGFFSLRLGGMPLIISSELFQVLIFCSFGRWYQRPRGELWKKYTHSLFMDGTSKRQLHPA